MEWLRNQNSFFSLPPFFVCLLFVLLHFSSPPMRHNADFGSEIRPLCSVIVVVVVYVCVLSDV